MFDEHDLKNQVLSMDLYYQQQQVENMIYYCYKKIWNEDMYVKEEYQWMKEME